MSVGGDYYPWQYENADWAARQLDRIKPDWWETVDPLTLDMANPDMCVCGQNGLGWVATADLTDDPKKFRFATGGATMEPLWLEEIAKRLPEVPVPEREFVTT